MNQIDELKSVERIIRMYNLPMSPILEYAITEKCEALAGCSLVQENITENDIVGRIREQIQSVVSGYDSTLTLLVDYDPRKGLIVRKQQPTVIIENADCQGRKGDTIRLLYKGKNNNLGSYLKEVLPDIYNYIKNFKEKNGGRKQCPLPSDLRKLLMMKRTETYDTFNLLIKAC